MILRITCLFIFFIISTQSMAISLTGGLHYEYLLKSIENNSKGYFIKYNLKRNNKQSLHIYTEYNVKQFFIDSTNINTNSLFLGAGVTTKFNNNWEYTSVFGISHTHLNGDFTNNIRSNEEQITSPFIQLGVNYIIPTKTRSKAKIGVNLRRQIQSKSITIDDSTKVEQSSSYKLNDDTSLIMHVSAEF
ncbi:hypothetical protein DID75_02355 [Candidatus Marinamargulisbacteria bacterium SCGC AG-410-N11]|nr:hypothetical protein DID75_02355 [Candidatus Marinamargulisbacteria bacterium SCGC AG-410-N11]